jgi:hypothetical protein
MTRPFVMTLAAMAMTIFLGTSRADDYSKWVKNAEADRWECDYTYTTKSGTEAKQKVLVYTQDKKRAGWAYFVNKDNKAWARCAIKGNPKHDPKKMYWQKLNSKGTGYEDYPEPGYCPAPADGKKPIPAIKHPPA